MDILFIIAQAFWLIAPAYAANAFPPLVRGRRPLDFGKSLRMNRILGDGKTFEGTIVGIVFGTFIGILQIIFQSNYPIPAEIGLVTLTIPIVLLLSAGAIVGDIVGAFIKRRLGMPRGALAPLLDQWDFLVVSLLLVSLLVVLSIDIIIFLLIITPIVHWVANLIGYTVKVKKTPW
jgi:CDP-2,3-bis-(O-geranylgeranyl)-sn-glycerol synthase